MSGTLAPQFWFQALDDIGVAVPGALVNFYVSGTSIPLLAYADAGLLVPLSNPAVCDAAGRLVVYLQPTAYKVIVQTPLGAQLGLTVDPVTATGAGAVGGVGAAVFDFGSNSAAEVTNIAYPAGATYDKLHPGTSVWVVDSGTLTGSYVLEAVGVQLVGGTLTVALVDLDDGSPNTPLVTCAITSLTGQTIQSAPISFAVGGTPKSYGIKTLVSANSGFLIAAKIVRTA